MAPRKTSGRKSTKRKYGRAAGKSVESAMRRRKKGTLRRGKAGHGGRVKSRRQAIAIGLSEAREKGAKVPSRGGRAKKGAKGGAKRSAKGGAKRSAKGGAKRSVKRTAKRTAKRSAKRGATRGAKRAGGRRSSE